VARLHLVYERGKAMKINLNDIVEGVKLSKVCSIKPDAGSEMSKKINLTIDFEGASLADVFAKAVSSTVIQWQNGIGRKCFDQFADGQTVDIKFKAPGARSQIDPEIAMVAKLQSMSSKEREAYLKELVAKVKG